jgi:hypothetical protein
MGTDINAVFGHQAPFPPTESVVEGMREGIHTVSPILGSDWKLLPDYNPGFGLVYIRGGLGISFGPHAAIVGTGNPWPSPTERPDEKQTLISAVCSIAGYFRSPRVIFLPDDMEPWIYVSKWVGEGLTLDQLQQHLASLKAPSATLRAAIRQRPECYEVDGYVIKELHYEAVSPRCARARTRRRG